MIKEYYDGPAWESFVYYDAYPALAFAGDIYINLSFAKTGYPLIYIWPTRKANQLDPVEYEDIKDLISNKDREIIEEHIRRARLQPSR